MQVDAIGAADYDLLGKAMQPLLAQCVLNSAC